MMVFTGDGSVALEVKAALDSTASGIGGIDILICAAAIHPYGTVETTDEATWDRVMSVNVKSAYLVANHGIRICVAGEAGRSSTSRRTKARQRFRNLTAYAASKGALLAFTRSLAMDFSPENIRANTVSPGPIDTPLLRVAAISSAAAQAKSVYADWSKRVPMRRMGKPEEMAEVIAFLASDRVKSRSDGRPISVADCGLLADSSASKQMGVHALISAHAPFYWTTFRRRWISDHAAGPDPEGGFFTGFGPGCKRR